MTRAQKVANAQKLRAQGLLLREIAERMGSKIGTVSSWLSDPDLSKQRKRREAYAGTCQDCGGSTTGCNGRDQAPKLCRLCEYETREVWTREEIIAAIQRWAKRFGAAPRATDWSVTHARVYRTAQQARRYKSGEWPCSRSVQDKFGSWANGIEAAGFARPSRGVYDRQAA